MIQSGLLAGALTAACLAGDVRAEPATGRVRCEVRDNGELAKGELVGPDGSRGSCAAGLDLPPGTHALRLYLRGTLDRSHVKRHARVEAGGETSIEADFETGELLLLALRGGQPAAATAEVWHDGEVRGRLRQGLEARVGVGTYVVDARAEGQSERFEAVHVNPGGRTVLVWQTQR